MPDVANIVLEKDFNSPSYNGISPSTNKKLTPKKNNDFRETL